MEGANALTLAVASSGGRPTSIATGLASHEWARHQRSVFSHQCQGPLASFSWPFRGSVPARLARGLLWQAERFVASGGGKYGPAQRGKHLSDLDHVFRQWLPHVMRHHAEVAGELELIVDLGGRFDADIEIARELESR